MRFLNKCFYWCWIFFVVCQSANATQCLNVFPSSYNQATTSNEQLTNFPANSSGAYLTDGTTLPRGDNFYLGSLLGNQDEVYVGPVSGGEVTARLYFRGSVAWQNVKINQAGNPEDLIIIVDGALDITGGQTDINAIIYVKGSVTVTGSASITGAVTSVGSGSASVNYNADYINNADFNGMCEGKATPLVEYRFDETSYDGSSNEVIDSINSFHGRAISTQPTLGKVCNAVDLSANTTADYLILDEDILNSTSDFTISLWVKTAKTNNQSILSGAGSGSSNELIMWFNNHTRFRPHLKGSHNGDISTTSIADDNWHHLVWVRSGTQNCLYRDNVLQGCITLSSSSLNIQSLILGQEQDSIGGGFSASQGWEGLIDEVIVFDSAISTDEIEQIYNNQNAGLGYDGSARVCPVMPDADPIADFHFDECSFTGASGDTVDQTGTYSATSQNGMSSLSLGVVEKAADISLYSQYFTTSIAVPSSFSVSTWFKKPTSTTNSRYFVLGAMQGGGDLLYLDRGNNWRWGVYDGSSSTNGSYSFSTLDNNWHHLIAVYSGSQTQLYIDGTLVDTINRKPSGTLQYIGTSYDSVGTSSAQGFRAPLDEFMVFDVALSTTQITNIYTYQLAGKNYDDSARTPVNCDPLVGLYTFEQSDFSSGITDSSGLDNHGTNVGGISTGNGKYCRAFDANGTNTDVATDNAFSSGIDLDNDVGTQGTISFWFNSNTPWNQGGYNGGGERTLFDASLDVSGADKYFALEIQNNGQLRFTFEDSADRDFSVQESTSTVRDADTWYYISATWNYVTDTFQLYVDGALVANQVRNTNGSMIDLGPIVFGDNAAAYSANNNGSLTSRTSANGKFDEVRIYTVVRTAAEIQADMLDVTCVPSINHFQIIHDGSAITCEAETVTIKACTNAFDGTCSLSGDTVTLDVNATVPPANTPAVINNITFTGSTTTDIAYTSSDTVVLSITNSSISPTSSTVCNDNSVGSCNLAFENTGFRFLVDGNEVNIPTQISGKPSNTGFDPANLALQAIKTNVVTGACEAAITNNVNIEIAAKCENPSDCAGEQVVINNTTISTLNNTSSLSYSNVSLDFGSNIDNTADFNFTYPDSGQVKLYARYNIPVNGSPSGDYMTGNSNSFVVRPFGFHMNIAPDSSNLTTNPKAQNASGAKFKKAGEEFEVIVSAVQWQSGDDIDNDGQADSNVVLKGNYITPNFGNEASPVKVELIRNLVAPFLGSTGILSGGLYSGFTSGIKSQNINWNEVGIISLTAQLENNDKYLLTSTVATVEPYVGRFTPDHFELGNIKNGDLGSVCLGNPSAYTYIGEMDEVQPTSGALKYGIEPEFTITAMSALCPAGVCSITQNYTGDFMKLLESGTNGKGVNKVIPLTDGTKTGTNVPAEKLAIQAVINNNYSSPNTIPDNKGVLTYTFNSSDNFLYTRNSNAKVTPFTSDINLEITSIIDEDEVAAIDFDNTDDAEFSGVLTLHPVGTNIRFGRWNIENAYGPETEDLPVAMSIQQWDGTKFVTNIDESCITPNTITNPGDKVGGAIWSGSMTNGQYRLVDLDLSDSLDVANTNATVTGLFENGVLTLPEGQFKLLAPDNSEQGQLRFEYQVPTWLQYDWQTQDGTFDDNPTSLINFGLFRGNDRIISWREVGN